MDIILNNDIKGVYFNSTLLEEIKGIKFNGVLVWSPQVEQDSYAITFIDERTGFNEVHYTNNNGALTTMPNTDPELTNNPYVEAFAGWYRNHTYWYELLQDDIDYNKIEIGTFFSENWNAHSAWQYRGGALQIPYNTNGRMYLPSYIFREEDGQYVSNFGFRFVVGAKRYKFKVVLGGVIFEVMCNDGNDYLTSPMVYNGDAEAATVTLKLHDLLMPDVLASLFGDTAACYIFLPDGSSYNTNDSESSEIGDVLYGYFQDPYNYSSGSGYTYDEQPYIEFDIQEIDEPYGGGAIGLLENDYNKSVEPYHQGFMLQKINKSGDERPNFNDGGIDWILGWQEPIYASMTIAEFINAVPNERYKIDTPMLVAKCTSSNLYVFSDSTGYLLVYDNTGTLSAYKIGQEFEYCIGDKAIYYGDIEMINITLGDPTTMYNIEPEIDNDVDSMYGDWEYSQLGSINQDIMGGGSNPCCQPVTFFAQMSDRDGDGAIDIIDNNSTSSKYLRFILDGTLTAYSDKTTDILTAIAQSGFDSWIRLRGYVIYWYGQYKSILINSADIAAATEDGSVPYGGWEQIFYNR